MNKRSMLTIAATLALVLPATNAPAIPAAPSARPSAAPAAAAPTASAAASAVASGPSLDVDPPSAEVSKTPKMDEWNAAMKVKLARNVPGCNAYRVREWLKIHCSGFPGAGASLVTGSRDGVLVWVDPAGGDGPDAMAKPRDAEVVFPLRRGDGRIFQIAQFGEGYDGPIGWNNAYAISEYWIDGEPAPIVTIR
jgi:hypothetical protein